MEWKIIGHHKGYREKSHRCLKYAVKALLVDDGVREPVVLEHFSFAMDLREGADYGSIPRSRAARLRRHPRVFVFRTVGEDEKNEVLRCLGPGPRLHGRVLKEEENN